MGWAGLSPGPTAQHGHYSTILSSFKTFSDSQFMPWKCYLCHFVEFSFLFGWRTKWLPALYSCLVPRLDKEKVHLVWKSNQRWRTLTVQLKKKKHFLTFFTFLLSYYLQRKMYFMNFMNWQSNFLFNQNINCKSNIYMFSL